MYWGEGGRKGGIESQEIKMSECVCVCVYI